MNRTKVTVACQACQKKKVKCTGSAPCTTCSRSGHKCIFSNNAKKRGPRNGNVEVIRTSAHRIEHVLQHYPGLRNQIEQMLESTVHKNNNNNSNNKQPRHSLRVQDLGVIDDDKVHVNNGYPYFVPTRSEDDITMKPQRRQDQFDSQESLQSTIFCRPLPVYPSNMQQNMQQRVIDDPLTSKRSDINRYPSMGPFTSHGNKSEVASSVTTPLLQDNMETSSIKDLTLPPPYTPSKRREDSMSVYSSSLGTQLLLPPPDLGMDYLQKSLISNPTSLNNNNNNFNGRVLRDLNKTFMNNNEKEPIKEMKISLPSLPSPLSSSSTPSPRSTPASYCPPTPTSATSPPLSPQHYTTKRSSIHLLSKPVPWCAHDNSFQQSSY